MEYNERLLTVAELAETLNVPRSWVYSRTRENGEGAIPKYKAGKYYRFQKSEVMEWMRAQSTQE